jgi:hypothetical protein
MRARRLAATAAKEEETKEVVVVDNDAIDELADVDDSAKTAAPSFHRGRKPAPRGRMGADPEEDMDLDIIDVSPDDIEEIGDEIDDVFESPEEEVEEIEEKVEDIEERVEALEEEVGLESEEEVGSEETLDGEEEEEEAVAASTEGTTDTFWAPLANKNEIVSLEDPDITMQLFNAETVDPHYVLFANGHPFGELRLSDIGAASSSQMDIFVSADYIPGVLKGISQIGLDEMLDTLNFRWYAAETHLPAAVDQIRQEVMADNEEAYKTRTTQIKGDLLSKMETAVSASLKNFMLHNPLKDRLVENFKKAGFDNEGLLIDAIEDAFRVSGAKYLADIVETADRWMGFDKEAFAQVKSEIDQMSYVHPLARAAFYEDDEYQEEEVTTASFPKSVPVRSIGPTPTSEPVPMDKFDELAESVKPILANSATIHRGRK